MHNAATTNREPKEVTAIHLICSELSIKAEELEKQRWLLAQRNYW
jgi:hypothetical protein